MPKSEFICPFCFTRHKLSEVQFRCTNRRCKQEADLEMTRYENGDVNMPKMGNPCFPVKMKGGKLPDFGECPQCGEKSYKMVCPSCHNPLPEATLKGTDMIISVVGARDTGKTHFVGVIINELIKRVAPGFGGSLEGFDDSYKRYKATFYQSLYIDKKKMPLTQTSLNNINNGAYRPYIFTLRLPKTGMFAGKKVDSFTLVFFDTAGEDLDDEDTMSTVNKYITASSGIIFLLDPLQIPEVRNQLPADVVAGASSVTSANDPNSIMTSVSHLIHKANHMAENEKIQIPVAATFSKFDAIADIVPDGLTVSSTSPHVSEGIFDMADWNNVNNEVKGLLSEWNYQDFISQADMNYSDCSFFAVSALGLHNNPRKDQSIDRPNPHRIEDPLLWLLKENNVIKATKFKG